jgi:DNA-directed RNA polymerase beta subunit
MQSNNELKLEHMGVGAMNFAAKHNSPSRSVMFASHLTQHLVIDGLDEQRIQTGLGMRFAPHTFNIKMPENGRILKIIDRYPSGITQDSLKLNPETIVIYENDETNEIDYFSIPRYASFHQTFGFEYKVKDAIDQLRPGAFVSKDTIFADSPAVSDNGGYMFGRTMNMAFMDIPSTSEDGIMICRDVLDKLKFKVYENRVVEFGSNTFPLNLFGNHHEYKPFMDIGDYLKDDGVLMMLRTYDDDLSPVDMSIYDTMEPDYVFDKSVYVRGGKGRIVDIKVIGSNNKQRTLPDQMSGQVLKYQRALSKFYQEIIKTEESLRYERKRKYGDVGLKISPKFHRLVVEALSVIDQNSERLKRNLNLIYRKAPIDEFRVEFVIEYELTPNLGFKLTDVHGGKGVICKIEDRENMPVDAAGNSADIVMDPASTISRMNLGRLHEHYLGASARDVCKEIMRRLGLTGKTNVNQLACMDMNLVTDAYNFLLGFYQIVSPKQYEFFGSSITDDEKLEHLKDIVNDGIYIYHPIENDLDNLDVVRKIQDYFPPTYGPVSYVGNSGKRCMTKDPIMIAPLYMMLLEKIADDWSAVSSSKLQHFGVLAPITKSEKFSYPFRNAPVRTIGETEGRIFAGYCGREAIAEMMDRSNNPTSQRNMIWNILDADKPSNIDEVVDRDFIALGNTKPIQLTSHIFACAGLEIVYDEE